MKTKTTTRGKTRSSPKPASALTELAQAVTKGFKKPAKVDGKAKPEIIKVDGKAHAAALKYGRELVKQNYGDCTVVRAITQRHAKMPRKDILAVAKILGFNAGTASRQYQEVRSGKTSIEF